jgi:hypothetical protein
MKDPINRDRRRLLQGLGATGVGLAFLPFLRRSLQAAPGPNARARRVLILNLAGGVRSSAAFHASPLVPFNPYGMMTPTTTTPFALGRLLDDSPIDLPPLPDSEYQLPGAWGGAQLPRLREIASQFSVLGTYSTDRGDHLRARIEEPTGSAVATDPGILTRIAAAFDAAGLTPSAPSFYLQPGALFGNGAGALTKFVPVSIQSHFSLPSQANVDPDATRQTGNSFATNELMRDKFDRELVDTRHNQAKLLASTFGAHRIGSRVIGARLAQPDMALANANTRAESFGTVTLPTNQTVPLENGMLYDLFTRCSGEPYLNSGINAALAIRLLQLGSPAVTLDLPSFDLHSGERTAAPPLYTYLGRLWAALRWLLPRIPDPSGEGSMFDRTLVLTMSDFGRDQAPGGWNAGEGTDHGADHGCFYLAHAVMGAGVTPNKLIGPVDNTSYNAANSAVRYNSRELLVTILDSLGFDPHDETWGLPTGGQPIAELWT